MRKLFWLSAFALAFPVTPAAAASPTLAPSGAPQSVYATLQTSCYTPEVPYAANDAPNDAMTGESDCPVVPPPTGESPGPYAQQLNSKPGFPAASSKLVKNHSESDIRVDPTNSRHLIGTSKWFVSSEGYNHLLGFYESFDGGLSWSVQGHIPGYEGFTDNTDPVGAFDGEGNFYVFILGYQFTYDASGHHDFSTGSLPNPNVPSWVVSVAVRPHGAKLATDWNTTQSGQPDFVAIYHSVGNNPDKQWIAIDTHKTLPNGAPNPNYDNVYVMWVAFDASFSSLPQVSVAHSNGNGTHSAWSQPLKLPVLQGTQADTYLLPHIAPDGTIYTTVVETPSAKKRLSYNLGIDSSSDGGKTWQGPQLVTTAQGVAFPPLCFGPFGCYQNTTFRDGIPNSFGVGQQLSAQGSYPLYLAFEAFDGAAGVTNVLLTASYDGGNTWSPAVRVNDNTSAVDEFQPSLAVSAATGIVSVAFYDRRWACAAAGTDEATNAGLAFDMTNPRHSLTPPYSANNYCVNTSIQFFSSTLAMKGVNVRLTQHSWDPQLNAAHYGCATCGGTFIGDYFGNDIGGGFDYVTTVTTFNENGQNPNYRQQQLVTKIAVP